MTRHVDIAIVGGGHAGLLAACWLRLCDFKVVVIDPRLGVMPPSGRTLAVLGGSCRALDHVGLWRSLEPHGVAVKRVDVADHLSDGHVHYRADDIGVAALAYGFRQSELRNHLRTLLPETVLCEDSVIETRSVAQQTVLACQSGAEISAKLVIGADGRQSTVRSRAKIHVDVTTYTQEALSFTVAHERPHRQTVIERMSAEGPLAILPVDAKQCGVTLVRKRGVPDLDEAAILARVDQLIEGRLGELDLASKIDRYPLSAQHAVRYVAPRLALIGDAAHGAHPIHAQGFNMGVADVGALAEILEGARARGEDIGGACLRRYEKSRRGDNSARLRMTDGLNRLFSNDLKPLLPVRRAILGGLSAFAPLRQRAIRHGMRLPD